MKIYRPTVSNYLFQKFGENSVCADLDQYGQTIRPFVVTNAAKGVCPLGKTPFYKALGMRGHNGEDWAIWRGEAIFFSTFIDGMKWRCVTEVDSSGGIGVNVISLGIVPELGTYAKFKFWHLLKVNVSDGQEIDFGHLIGFGDSTGASSGDHLHWSMKQCEKDGTSINKNNGYYGAVDFADWFDNVFVGDIIRVKAQAISLGAIAQVLILEAKQAIIAAKQAINEYKGRK